MSSSQHKAVQAYEKGLALQQAGKLQQAANAYRRAISLQARFPEAHSNLGNVLLDLGKAQAAIEHYRSALKHYPDHPMILSNLGNAYRETGQLARARDCLTRCIEAAPQHAGAHTNLANVYRDLAEFERAELAYREALRLDPALAECRSNYGMLLAARGRHTESIAQLSAAIEADPDNLQAQANLGRVYAHQGERAAALRHLGLAGDLAPDDHAVLTDLFFACRQAFDWPGAARAQAKLARLETRGAAAMPVPGDPFPTLVRSDDLGVNLRIARYHAAQAALLAQGAGAAFNHAGRRRDNALLRIGYLSADFHDHATAHLMRGMLREHDRERFEIYCYSYGRDDDSGYRADIVRYSTRFVELGSDSDLAAAQRIHADRIDILVDLKGHTTDARLEICAARPAPVQVTYLGFPGTSGAEFFDYVIGDPVVTPPAHAPYYDEKLVLLPGTYQCTDNRQPIAAAPSSRADRGLAEDALVLCCFNQIYKLDIEFFRVWIGLLEARPQAVLWLLAEDPLVIDNIRAAAAGLRVDPQRIVFAARCPKDEHLRRLQLADLMLDTRIYNGHTTSSDALWAGVPVLTVLGRHFASRVSASLLQAAGVPELIAADAEAYEALLHALCSDRARLAGLRSRLADNRERSVLFDTTAFTRALESAYEAMWSRYSQGQPPALLDLTAAGA